MKSVLITGASSGIGAETARLFSKKGFFVFLAGRSQDRLSQVQASLENSQQSELVAGDISDPTFADTAAALMESKQKQFPLQALINNAGIFFRKRFEETPAEIWNEQFQVNLLGPVLLTKKLLPLLKNNPGSAIVNVSSSLGVRPVAETSAYSAIKAAMINWTQTLALELAPHQVRVNCVAPGLVHTPIHEFYGKETPELQAQLDAMQPLGRIGTSEEISQAIYFLASSDSKWTTGSQLLVDGGISL